MNDIDTLHQAVADGKLVWGAVPAGESRITVADLHILDPTDPAAWKRSIPGDIVLCWEFRFVTGWAWTCYDLTYMGPSGEDTELLLFEGSLDDPQDALDLCLVELARMDERMRRWRSEAFQLGTVFVKMGTPGDALSVFFSDWLEPHAGVLATGTPAGVTAKISANFASRLDRHREWWGNSAAVVLDEPPAPGRDRSTSITPPGHH